MIYLLLAVLSSAAMTIALKIFRSREGNRYGILLGNYLTCVVIAFLNIKEKTVIFHPEPATLVCGILDGFFFVTCLVLMQGSIEKNGAILTAAFSKLGILVPLILSIFYLGEKPELRQGIGIVLVLISFLLINSGNEGKAAAPVLLFATLLVGGCGDSMAKIFERVGEREQDSFFFFILFLTACILTMFLADLEYHRTGRKLVFRELVSGVGVGIPNYYSSSLLLMALVHLPAFLVYPGFSTGTILVVTLLGALFFKERPGNRQKIGLLLIIGALVLLNL